MDPTTEVSDSLKFIRGRIAQACARVHHSPESICLIAVSKTVSPERILAAYNEGNQRDFGENYWQEAREKIPLLPSDIHWHFIGKLQTNKAKYTVGRFKLIHSVDRVELLQEIQRQASKQEIVQDVLLEVKLSSETAKSGAPPDQLPDLVGMILSLPHVRLLGLMGMAPYSDQPERARPYFARLRALFETLPAENRVWLSMGMTGDFEIAIEEGSNMLRIGTAIFGAR